MRPIPRLFQLRFTGGTVLTVFVSRKNARPIVISVADDDDFLSKEELLSVQKWLEDIKNGRTYRMQEGESLTDFLKRTEECIK
jgi:prevent-host-death family protein